jgi:hypothetical protein
MQARRRIRTGWFFTVTGFLACPCHLVITVPLAVALLSGTALGGWIATHEGAIAVGATLYFVGALALGATLLTQASRRAAKTDGAAAAPADDVARKMIAASCCPPNLTVGRPVGEAPEETSRYTERGAESAEAQKLGAR